MGASFQPAAIDDVEIRANLDRLVWLDADERPRGLGDRACGHVAVEAAAAANVEEGEIAIVGLGVREDHVAKDAIAAFPAAIASRTSVVSGARGTVAIVRLPP